VNVTDDELVTAALAGDTAAFAALVVRNRTRVEAIVARLIPEDAEDVVQEALLRAYLGLSQLRDPARFGAWLCGIAVNLAKMRLRRRALEARVVAEHSLTNGAEDREVFELVRDAIEVLPSRQRQIVLMHYVDGLSCEEIAALLGSSPGAVRVRLHRARRQLREQLAALAPPPPPKEEIRMIEMKLEDVIVRVADDEPTKLAGKQRIVLLKETGGERMLPIWVGAPEGDALAFRVTGETTPRPMTSDLMAELVRVTGARVERVVVTSIREKVFYAVVALAVNGDVDELDARPSDALNLAVRLGAPIFVEDGVLEQSAMLPHEVAARMDAETGEGDADLAPGEWRSLSAELLGSLYRWP
jgi:uncharacterized protein